MPDPNLDKNNYQNFTLDSPAEKYSPTQPIGSYYVPQKYSVPASGKFTYEDFKK